MKICGTCKKEKDLTEFHRRAASPDGLCHNCKSCRKSYYQKYDRDLEKKRAERMLRLYGVTPTQYENLLASQDYRCALCKKHQSEFKRALAIDHDHTCCPGPKSCGECVRGLLCPGCNTFLGKVEAGTVTLEQLAAYQHKFAQ